MLTQEMVLAKIDEIQSEVDPGADGLVLLKQWIYEIPDTVSDSRELLEDPNVVFRDLQGEIRVNRSSISNLYKEVARLRERVDRA